MLTRLRFKNWRSLRDVEITDLTPITVLIGANSSGKTNILDALRFLQYSNTAGNRGIVGAIRYKWGGREKIHTLGVPLKEPIEIEFSFLPHSNSQPLTDRSVFQFYQGDSPLLQYSHKLTLGQEIIEESATDLPVRPGVKVDSEWFRVGDLQFAINEFVYTYIKRRWQLFKEHFAPQLVLPPSDGDPGDLYVVEENGRNIAFMLDFMRMERPDLYERLDEDLRWLLSYVEGVETKRSERELNIIIREKAHQGLEAPSISAGTARLIAVLTAYYALEMETGRVQSVSGDQFEGWTIPIHDMPGLVAIEEPDTSLNPLLLKNLVEQLRNYVADRPRQFILTTHNPYLLDLFEPEEVRIVERDEQGYTTVKKVPEHIKEIWLDKYGLGEVWTTRSLGGVPE